MPRMFISMKDFNLKQTNYNNFIHKKVFKRFELDKYLGDISIDGYIWALYYTKTPDRSKEHKPYVGLIHDKKLNTLVVTGWEKEEIDLIIGEKINENLSSKKHFIRSGSE